MPEEKAPLLSKNQIRKQRRGKKGSGIPWQVQGTKVATEMFELKTSKRKEAREKRKHDNQIAYLKSMGIHIDEPNETEESESVSDESTDTPEETPEGDSDTAGSESEQAVP